MYLQGNVGIEHKISLFSTQKHSIIEPNGAIWRYFGIW
jgi:hypothetical protein